MGAIVFQPNGEVKVRKILDGGLFELAGILKGEAILEVDDQIVYGLRSFYDLIAKSDGQTKLLIESQSSDLRLVEIDLGEPLPGGGTTDPSNTLDGIWYSGFDSQFHLSRRDGACKDGSSKETYAYKSFYRSGVQSFGYVTRDCGSGKLSVKSEKYGFRVYGSLQSGNYMVWYQVPIFDRRYDFHIWR